MPKPTQTPETINLSEVTSPFAEFVNEVYLEEKRIIIEKEGIPIAAVVPLVDLERLAHFEQDWNDQFAILDQLREAFKGVPPARIEEDVTALVRQMRNEEDDVSRELESGLTGRQSA